MPCMYTAAVHAAGATPENSQLLAADLCIHRIQAMMSCIQWMGSSSGQVESRHIRGIEDYRWLHS